MNNDQFSESVIVSILQSHQHGKSVEEICLEYDISEAMLHNWKAKYGQSVFLNSNPIHSDKKLEVTAMPSESERPIIHFDRALLLERCGNKKELVSKLIAIVLDDLPKQLDKISGAIAQNQLEDLWKTAHKIKGTGLNLNLPALKDIAATLEQTGRNSDSITEDMKQMVDALYTEWKIVEPLLKNN